MDTMSFLSMVEASLPPGFRFHPRDDELLCDYLMPKLSDKAGGSFCGCPAMIDVDLNKCEPWELPEAAVVGGKEWYFFSLRDRKYATGQRTNRATLSGYWKATGKDRPVSRRGSGQLGMRKTLVFHRGRAPKGRKTDWVMHEFRFEPAATPAHPSPPLPPPSSSKEDWVLCRVSRKQRDICTTPRTAACCADAAMPPPFLPPLMDPHPRATQLAPEASFEQVSCFSSPATPGDPTLPTLGGLPSDSGSYWLNPLSCHEKIIEAVLSQNGEVGPNLGAGGWGGLLVRDGSDLI